MFSPKFVHLILPNAKLSHSIIIKSLYIHRNNLGRIFQTTTTRCDTTRILTGSYPYFSRNYSRATESLMGSHVVTWKQQRGNRFNTVPRRPSLTTNSVLKFPSVPRYQYSLSPTRSASLSVLPFSQMWNFYYIPAAMWIPVRVRTRLH